MLDMFVVMDIKTFEFDGTRIRYQHNNNLLMLSTPDFFKALNTPKPNNLSTDEAEWMTLPRAKHYASGNAKMLAKLASEFMVIPDLYADGGRV
jgi:hypothetical protein